MRKLLSTAAVTLLAAVCLCVTAGAVGYPEGSSNVGGVYSGFRGYWAEPPSSYLYSEGDEVVRVENLSGRVTVERYDETFHLRTSGKIMGELPVWGGFFAGKDWNFLVYGQDNPYEDDTREVIRVVRYTKDWERVDHASFYGINTVKPFSSGGFSAAEYGGLLHIHAGHTLYQSADGINHQANFTVSVRQSDMTVADTWVHISAPDKGYVSHSYNQHLLVDREGRMVTLDHGDALPRGAWLFRRSAPADALWPLHGGEGAVVTRFGGEIGDNETGAYVTGFVETADAYLSLCTTEWEEPWERNLYLFRTPKDDFSATEKYLVARNAGEGKLVPVDETGGYLIWTDDMDERLFCAPYHADGSVGATLEIPALLSDCQPIVHKEKVVWYASNFQNIIFYTLDETGVTACEAKAETNPFAEFSRGPEGEFLVNWSPAVEDALYYGLLVATAEGEWQTLGYSEMNGETSAEIWNGELPPGIYTRFRIEPREKITGDVIEESCYEIGGIELTVSEETALRKGTTLWKNDSRYLRYEGLKPMDVVRFAEEEWGVSCTAIRRVEEDGTVTFSVPRSPTEHYRYSAVYFTDIVCRGEKAAFRRVLLALDERLADETEPPEGTFSVFIQSPAPRDTEVKLTSQTHGSEWLCGQTPLAVEFPSLRGDGYTLEIAQEGCLTWRVTEISFLAGDVSLGEIELLGGDVNGDDMINIMDMGAFRQNFGKVSTNILNKLTDVNGDNMVNIMDMGVFRSNFGKTAAKDCTAEYQM